MSGLGSDGCKAGECECPSTSSVTPLAGKSFKRLVKQVDSDGSSLTPGFFDYEPLEAKSPAEDLEQPPVLVPLCELGKAKARGPALRVIEQDRRLRQGAPGRHVGFRSSGHGRTRGALYGLPLGGLPCVAGERLVRRRRGGRVRMKNMEQRKILDLSRDKLLRWITVQVARVKRTLGSVGKNVDCDQRMV